MCSTFVWQQRCWINLLNTMSGNNQAEQKPAQSERTTAQKGNAQVDAPKKKQGDDKDMKHKHDDKNTKQHSDNKKSEAGKN